MQFDVLKDIREYVFDPCGNRVSQVQPELESAEYGACTFELDGLKIRFRISKKTPTKTGQFVTLWKRSKEGPIVPFHRNDKTDYFIISAKDENRFGQFIFPKQVLYEKGILSGEKPGKLGFRIYPPWDLAGNKQAKKTQDWQLHYFVESPMNKSVDIKRVKYLLHL
ncbi:MepB family protein [Leptospira idonii]|uniref:MepB protein n=1 Tax=Leptospira idonii TaxID=1193500 RepID=A0A4R9LUC7_9LEPT|nr:MepB family protein [Leptospira idonii]TGN17386.1 mepB protein [Leptospira idonii]